MDAREFLNRLYGGKPDHLYILVWTTPDKRSHWCQTVDIAETVIRNLKGHEKNIYIGIGLASHAYSTQERAKAQEIAGLVAVWADVDFESPVHAGKRLPKNLTEALEILPKRLPPTFTILTGHGAQFWWALKEPEIFDNDAERERAHKILLRWHTLLRLNASTPPGNWQLDRLADLSRVARVPGSWNHKENKPKLVEIHSAYDFTYNLRDFENYLDLLGVPAEEKIPQPNYDSIRSQVATSGLHINLHATIDPDWIELWISADPQFARTWRHERTGFPSQSEYDMALCHFGVRISLDQQKIIDLCVQHRRIQGGKKRTQLKYYIDTIRKAEERHQQFLEDLLLLAPPPADDDEPAQTPPPPANGADPETPPKPTAAAPLAILNQRLSLRSPIVRVVKILAKTGAFRIEFQNGSSIRFATAEAMIDQKSFRNAIAGHLYQLIPHHRPTAWDPIASAMLKSIVELPGGVELEEVSSVQKHVREYLEATPLIADLRNEPKEHISWPTIHEGQIAIQVEHFAIYLKFKNIIPPLIEIVQDLLSIGARQITITPSSHEQTRWLLPPMDFPLEIYQKVHESRNENQNDSPVN